MNLPSWATKFEVSVHLKSGRRIVFYADTITTTRDPASGDLTSLKTKKSRFWPLYTRLDDVSCVQTRTVPFFWRRPK